MLTIKADNTEINFNLGCEKCSLQFKEHQIRETLYVRMNVAGEYTIKRVCGACGHQTEYYRFNAK